MLCCAMGRQGGRGLSNSAFRGGGVFMHAHAKHARPENGHFPRKLAQVGQERDRKPVPIPPRGAVPAVGTQQEFPKKEAGWGLQGEAAVPGHVVRRRGWRGELRGGGDPVALSRATGGGGVNAWHLSQTRQTRGRFPESTEISAGSGNGIST